MHTPSNAGVKHATAPQNVTLFFQCSPSVCSLISDKCFDSYCAFVSKLFLGFSSYGKVYCSPSSLMETPIAQWPVIWPSSRLAIEAAIIDLATAMGRPLRPTRSIAVRARDPNANQLQVQAKDKVGRDSHHVCKMEILHQVHQQLLIP